MKDRPTVYILIDTDGDVIHGVYMEKQAAIAEIEDRAAHDDAMGFPRSDYVVEEWKVIS